MAALALLLLVAAPQKELRPVSPTYWIGRCVQAGCAARHPGIKPAPGRPTTWRS